MSMNTNELRYLDRMDRIIRARARELREAREAKAAFLREVERRNGFGQPPLVVADDAPLDRLGAAVDAVSPALPPFDIHEFANNLCRIHAEQGSGFAANGFGHKRRLP
jgi:hypothetical protein